MHPLPARRGTCLLLALAIGSGAPLLISGCGEKTPTPQSVGENKPTITAKDSMDFYKKTKNNPPNSARR